MRSDNSISKPDLLLIDTEGFDTEIIRMFPFERIRLNNIHFESKYIPKYDMEMVLDDLISKGYIIGRDQIEDMIAVLEEK